MYSEYIKKKKFSLHHHICSSKLSKKKKKRRINIYKQEYINHNYVLDLNKFKFIIIHIKFFLF